MEQRKRLWEAGHLNAGVAPLFRLTWDCPECEAPKGLKNQTVWAEGDPVTCRSCGRTYDVESEPACPEERDYSLYIKIGKRIN